MKEKENSEKTEQNKTEITIKKYYLVKKKFSKNLKSILNKKKYIYKKKCFKKDFSN